MTMNLTGPVATKPDGIMFGDLVQGDCFTTHRGGGATVYQKIEQRPNYNAAALGCGTTIEFVSGAGVHRVTVDATCRWTDD